jgi:hypothetical protein
MEAEVKKPVFMAFCSIFGHRWVVVVAHEVTAEDC